MKLSAEELLNQEMFSMLLLSLTEYYIKFQDVVAPFPGEEQVSNLKRPLLRRGYKY